jgi:hypothetical protein
MSSPVIRAGNVRMAVWSATIPVTPGMVVTTVTGVVTVPVREASWRLRVRVLWPSITFFHSLGEQQIPGVDGYKGIRWWGSDRDPRGRGDDQVVWLG